MAGAAGALTDSGREGSPAWPSTVAEMRWNGEGERRDKQEEVRSARSGQRRAWVRKHRGAEQRGATHKGGFKWRW